MTGSTLQSTPKVASSPEQGSGQLVIRPLQQMLDMFGESLERLYDQTPNPHPYLHPACLQAHFGDVEADVYLAALEQDGQLRCAGILDAWSLDVGRLPRTQLTWRLRGRRVFAKGLLWDGADDAVGSWLHGIAPLLRNHKWAGLMVEAVAIDTPLWAAMSSALNDNANQLKLLRPQKLQPRWRIRLPSTVDEFWSTQFKGKTRNTLRRKRKKLGDYRVDVYSEPGEVNSFLEAATAVSEHTWQSRELGLRVKNSEQEQRLFRALAERSEFRGHIMWLEDRPVAFVINTSHDGYLHYEETGFLPDLSHLSPGTVLVSELIDDVIASGEYHTIDFGLGHADYKQLFSNEQTESSDLWLLRNSPVNAIAAGMISTQDSLKTAAKAALQRSGVLRRLKKLKRGH